ncbi:hypothetical protein AGMMS50229_03260 [Campylobacterota bacterium]|nr:hypothetical protein AGMMS50229_03260 [Campylobacterota bacterium]
MSEHDIDDMEEDEGIVSKDRESQLEMMRNWFFEHFEDPANSMPYESKEGGYIWICGAGPHDAYSELYDQFSDTVSHDIIDELANELGWMEWASKDYDYDDIDTISEYRENFDSAIVSIESLLDTKVEKRVSDCFYRLLFANTITALETYLSDAFIHTVAPDQTLMRRFIESAPEFKNQKCSLSDVFKIVETVEQRAKGCLDSLVWHNLKRVRPMYRATLGIDFPDEIGSIFTAIDKRHDIVHRNGKTVSGDEVCIEQHDVVSLISTVNSFVEYIDVQLNGLKSDIPAQNTQNRWRNTKGLF